MIYNCNTIYFNGGGIRGYSYLGVLSALREKLNINKQFDIYIGVSIGSIFAFIAASNINLEKLREKIFKTNDFSLNAISDVDIDNFFLFIACFLTASSFLKAHKKLICFLVDFSSFISISFYILLKYPYDN